MEDKRKLDIGELDEDTDDTNDGVVRANDMESDGGEQELQMESLFDDDGNYIGIDDEDEQEEVPEQEEPVIEQKEQAPIKQQKQLPPSEAKIVAMKREMAEQQALIKQLKEQNSQKEQESKKEEAKKKLIDEGYPEEYASKYAEQDIKLAQLIEAQEKSSFREDNEDVFAKYPEAKKDIITIMKNSKLTGMTAEQICKGLYGTDELPLHEQRAIDSVNGKPIREMDKRPNLNASRSPEGTESLTESQRTEIKRLERILHIKLTAEEIKRIK